jgi:hypothetical protein
MPVTVRVEPIDRDVRLIIDETLSPAARSKMFAADALAFIQEGDEINRRVLGRVPPRKVYVDGREGAPLDSVRPDGVIVAEWEILSDLIVWIGEQLVANSPRLSGRYAASHVLFADGEEVPIGEEVPAADEYVFLNIQPYARKIEGDGTRSPESRQAPEGVYRLVAALAQREARFRGAGNVRVTFSFRTAVGPSIIGGRRGNRSQARNPAIIVTVR